MTAAEHFGSSYQIVVLGELGPVLLAFCARRPPDRNETCGVFQLRIPDGQGIAELAAMLQAADLTIVSIRQVTEREVWAETRPPAELRLR
jgi:hypothetical protein